MNLCLFPHQILPVFTDTLFYTCDHYSPYPGWDKLFQGRFCLFLQSILQDQQSQKYQVWFYLVPGSIWMMEQKSHITVFLTGSKTKTKSDIFLSEWSPLTRSCTIPGTLNVCRNYPERKQERAQGYRDFCSDRTEMKRGCLLRMRLTLIFVENELNDHKAVFHLLWWFSSPYLLTATREF